VCRTQKRMLPRSRVCWSHSLIPCSLLNGVSFFTHAVYAPYRSRIDMNLSPLHIAQQTRRYFSYGSGQNIRSGTSRYVRSIVFSDSQILLTASRCLVYTTIKVRVDDQGRRRTVTETARTDCQNANCSTSSAYSSDRQRGQQSSPRSGNSLESQRGAQGSQR
jgi:hypothetical protein